MIDIPDTPVLDQIAAVASETGEAPITGNQVAAVLAAFRAISEGDPVGTLRRDPDTGATAHRVSVDGLHMWRVSHPDGSQYNDLAPSLPWPRL